MTLRRFTCAYHPVMKMQKLLENLLQFFNSWVCIKSRMLQLQISLEILTCYALDSMHADEEESRKTRSSGGLAQLSSRGPAAGAIMPTFDVSRRVMPKSARTQIHPIFFQVHTWLSNKEYIKFCQHLLAWDSYNVGMFAWDSYSVFLKHSCQIRLESFSIIFSFHVLMISSEKPYLRSSCSAIKSLNFSVLYFSHHLFLAASESACLLGFDGGKYCNLKWFVIYWSEKSFKLIININGMSLNLVPGKLPEEHWCATLWGLEVPIAIIGKSWQAAALFK